MCSLCSLLLYLTWSMDMWSAKRSCSFRSSEVMRSACARYSSSFFSCYKWKKKKKKSVRLRGKGRKDPCKKSYEFLESLLNSLSLIVCDLCEMLLFFGVCALQLRQSATHFGHKRLTSRQTLQRGRRNQNRFKRRRHRKRGGE